MISFHNLTYTYPGAARPALRDITLDIPEGGFALLVGPSGCGKSTLARSVGGLVPHFSGGALRGNVRVDGRDPVAEGPARMSQIVGFVFQDPEAQAVLDRVEDEIAFALEHAGLPRAEMRVRVEETLDLLDLAALRDRTLDTLSGGERQRVAIAAALALRPRILVLDEPTSQLDPQSAEDVLQALVRLNSDLGLTIVLAEHRLERVLPFAEQIIFLEDGVARSGPPDALMPDIPLAPPLVALGKALGWSPLPLTIKAGLRWSRALTAQRAALPAQQPAQSPTLPLTLELQHVETEYDRQPILRGVSLAVAPGEIVAVLGRNGAGKTTLLRCLAGLVRPARGRALVRGRDNAGRDVAAICRDVGYLPQDPNALLFADTVREELQITLRNHGIADAGAADALLERLGLAGYASAYPRDLSAGERQRVALGAILVTQPRALLLDEPTRGLDYLAKQRLADLLRGWRAEGMAALLVTHDVEFAALLADRVLLLGRGEVVASGPIATLGDSPLFAPQIARLFPGSGWLTTEDALRGLGRE
jgi:energy-coupling factor transport system ATP-binding protein